jgi:hypothetical protein
VGPQGGEVSWAPEAGGDPAGEGLAGGGIRFGDSLIFQGYRLAPDELRPGERLQLVTAWQVLATPPPRLVLFTHLLADPQTVLVQQDSLPLTTQSLRPGDRFMVLHDQIVVPAGTPAGAYTPSIGIYSSDTLLRLPVYDYDNEAEQARGDRLFLKPLNVIQ